MKGLMQASRTLSSTMHTARFDVSYGRTLPYVTTVGPQMDQEVEKGHGDQRHSSLALLGPQLGQGEHNMHKVPVAENGDHHGDEKDKTKLQPRRRYHIQLLLWQVLMETGKPLASLITLFSK